MELCRKSGEKVLGDIIVVLKERSASQDARTRTGACLLLTELMSVFTTLLLCDFLTMCIGKVRLTHNGIAKKMRSSTSSDRPSLMMKLLYGLQQPKPSIYCKNSSARKRLIRLSLLSWRLYANPERDPVLLCKLSKKS